MVFLGVVSVVLLYFFIRLDLNLKQQFRETEQNYEYNLTVNLSAKTSKQDIAEVLINRNYFDQAAEADIVAEILSQKLAQFRLHNLGGLNKSDYMIQASWADSVGIGEMKDRVSASQEILNWSDEVEKLYASDSKPSDIIQVGTGDKKITARVLDQDKNPVEGVLVKFRQHFLSSVLSDPDSIEIMPPHYFGTTNAKGYVVFKGLDDEGSYSVLPVRKWFEYGYAQGTVTGRLGKNMRYTFTEKPHQIRIFSPATYVRIKEDKAFTVRTPSEYKRSFNRWLLLFFLGWWLLSFFYSIQAKPFNQCFLPLLMFLTGFCVLIMYSIHDPTADLSRGNEMVKGTLAGIFLFLCMSLFDPVNFYRHRWFDPLSQIPVLKKGEFLPGYGYLLAGIGLTVLLVLFGQGPEGSGVRINLNIAGISFQPAEMIKYLAVIFFAAFFSKKDRALNRVPDVQYKLFKIRWIAWLFSVLLIIFLILGDLGPALILCMTFIVLYSVARNDLAGMLAGTVLFILVIIIGSLVFGKDKVILAVVALAWLGLWLVFTRLFKNQVFESAIMVWFVIMAFQFGDILPSVGQRLQDRNEISVNIWDNQVFGGDQVAHGIWGLASGGFKGLGSGNGQPAYIPAAHTDMVLSALGEELGWIGIFIFIVILSLLLFLTVNTGRKVAHPFIFYICLGISVVTGIQFMLIAFGSIGWIPLTGVSVPFLSYGKVGMMVNIAVFGLVFSASRDIGKPDQQESLSGYNERMYLIACSWCLMALLLVLKLLWIQWLSPGKYLTKPAYVVNRSGERISSYNPRIYLLAKALHPGDILDRHGYILATSKKESIIKDYDAYIDAGAADSVLQKQLKSSYRRYYPFENHTFFWLGNLNHRLLWGNENKGFFAEYRYLSDLRGYNTQPAGASSIMLSSVKYRENRFLPAYTKEFDIKVYDYSELIPLLKDGLHGRKVTRFNERIRDIRLTLDVRLQTMLQNELIQQLGNDRIRRNWRTSVLVLNAHTGELLSSAVYPLPGERWLKLLYEMPVAEQVVVSNTSRLLGTVITDSDLGTTLATPPGSTAKIITGMASLMHSGREAITKTYYVSAEEQIRKGRNEADPVGRINLERAIVESSNVYFIKLVNEERLDAELSAIYNATGISVNNRVNYLFDYYHSPARAQNNHFFWQQTVYNMRRSDYRNPNLTPGRRLRSELSYLAWGQGQMDATPMAMARVLSVVANNGTFVPTRYVMEAHAGVNRSHPDNVILINPQDNKFMQSFMRKQAASISRTTGHVLYGKTGTPQRFVAGSGRVNDAWYTFYAHSPLMNAPVVVCIRIEQGQASSNAVRLAQELVIPVLEKLDYLK